MNAQSCSESDALRRLGLAESRREWLRNKLPNCPISGIIAYEVAAVEALGLELTEARAAVARGERRSIFEMPTRPAIFTR